MTITSDADPAANFVGRKTYAWMPGPQGQPADARINNVELDACASRKAYPASREAMMVHRQCGRSIAGPEDSGRIQRMRAIEPILFESLEPRVLLSGDVTAALSGGMLKIIGDENPNQIAIEMDSDEVQIVGLDGESINGTDEVSFKNVTGIKLQMKKGMDSVSVQNVSLDKLRIDLGHGSDKAEIKDSVIGAIKIFGRKIKSITKTNLIDIQNLMANKLILRGDDDFDANITKSDLGRFRFAVGFAGASSHLNIDESDIESFRIQTRAEQLEVELVRVDIIKNLRIKTLAFIPADDCDDGVFDDCDDDDDTVFRTKARIRMDDVSIGSKLAIKTGAGRDTITLNRVEVAGKTTIITHRRDDLVQISESSFIKFRARLRAGDDEILVSSSSFGDRPLFMGGPGIDCYGETVSAFALKPWFRSIRKCV